MEQLIAIRMKSSNLQAFRIEAAQLSLYPLPHFIRSIVGVSEGQNFVRAGVAFPNEIYDPANEDRSLASTGTGQHQHGTA